MVRNSNRTPLDAAYADLRAGRHEVARLAFEALDSEGQPLARLYLGWMHERGLGVEVDEARAADLYCSLCEQNDPVACYYAASLKFRRGDTTGALKLYLRASDMGHPSAAYWASAIYGGEGGHDRESARERAFLALAASRGHAFARRDLAKHELASSTTFWGKGRAFVRYVFAVLRGFAVLARDPDDPRVR